MTTDRKQIEPAWSEDDNWTGETREPKAKTPMSGSPFSRSSTPDAILGADWSAEGAEALGHDWTVEPGKHLAGVIPSDGRRYYIVGYERVRSTQEPTHSYGQWVFGPLFKERPALASQRYGFPTIFAMVARPGETLAQAHERVNAIMEQP
jgi:hypothetical protein